MSALDRGVIGISTFGKLENRIKAKPTPNDISFDDFDKYLIRKGFVLFSKNGSHYVYVHPVDNQRFKLTIVKPHGRSGGVKPYYISVVLNFIEDYEL
ncbi:MAG: type II toxin-antitoxin system HicA family toxin [Ruminococcaceae bacterium]|nr:type II toxin-antitoxin system HicA family toxin [Oscillospiraceae bacterium]